MNKNEPQTAVIIISPTISFFIGHFYDTRFWYFTCSDNEYYINLMFDIDTEKPFTSVESARKYAEQKVSRFLKTNMFLLNNEIKKESLKFFPKED